MGRLIDADALIKNLESDAEQMEEPIAKMFTYAAINNVKNAPTVDAIPLGEELWADRFNIRTRNWRDADGNLMGVSFLITRKEAEDDKKS